MYRNQRRNSLTQGIFSMWANWTIAVGFLALLVTVAPLLPARTVPLLALALGGAIAILDRRNRRLASPVCFKIQYVIQAILIIGAICLFLTILYKLHSGIDWFIHQPTDKDTPLIGIVIVSPIATLVCAYYWMRSKKHCSCHLSSNRFGGAVDRGLLGMLYLRESKYQIKTLCIVSGVTAVICWAYYLLFYININISKSDTFFFIICPSVAYVLSVLYFGVRYYILWVYYCQNNAFNSVMSHNGTVLRYIVVCDGKILLTMPDYSNEISFSDEFKIDVPVKVTLPYRENMSEHEAHQIFVDASKLTDAETRMLFKSSDRGMYNNVFHYVAYTDDADKAAEMLRGQWFTLAEVNELIKSKMVSVNLGYELSRIYTITMAWKTYDSKGRRLYAIRHYRPTFHLKDMRSWDVDYNDSNWLYVAHVNQDKPFYRLHRLWNKLTKGEGKYNSCDI